MPCVGARVVRIVVGLEAQPRAPTYSLAALGCMTRLATKDAHLHAVSRTLVQQFDLDVGHQSTV